MVLETLFIGLVVGIIYYELVGISPGGVIAPAYFSLYIFYPHHILLTLCIAIVVFLIINLLSSITILFGKRRLLIAIILGFCIKYLIESQVLNLAYPNYDLHFIGYIIPGLIANEIQKQKLIPTMLSIGIVTILIFLVRVVVVNL